MGSRDYRCLKSQRHEVIKARKLYKKISHQDRRFETGRSRVSHAQSASLPPVRARAPVRVGMG